MNTRLYYNFTKSFRTEAHELPSANNQRLMPVVVWQLARRVLAQYPNRIAIEYVTHIGTPSLNGRLVAGSFICYFCRLLSHV